MASSPPDAVPKDEVSWIDNQLFESALEEKAEIVSIDVKRATSKGDNFQSSLYRTRVEYRIPGSDAIVVKDFIVKSLPPGEFMQMWILQSGIFRTEISVYSKALPNMYTFADSRLGETFKRFTPRFYQTTRPNTLILEDLKTQKFTMVPRKDRLDYTHAKLVLLYLARFHALSIAYSASHSDFFSDFEETMFSEKFRQFFDQFFPPIAGTLIAAVKSWDGFGDIVKKLERNQSKFVDKLLEVCKPAEKFTNVLAHGDCWMNNILFEYSESGEPIDLRFVDFQASRKSSPAIDLHYFLFTSLQNEVRNKKFDDLLQIYCNEVARFAKQLGYNESIFTYDELRQEMDRTLFFGFNSAITTMAGLLANPDDTPDMKDMTQEKLEKGDLQIFNKTYENPVFREIFQDLLPYFDKHGVFD
ncbi:hypothetical protein R5R35_001951 [Gryllus longicercus]|uniref:CHK kinase-like domain-containing protein n=1 Tax=Gryllus longicercus TaxID=2509291 RepID=A0AAN9VVY0_9ORTH